MNTFEDRLTAALETELAAINEHTVRRTSVPAAASEPYRRVIPMVTAVATVAVVALIMGVIGAHHSTDRREQAASGASASVTDEDVSVRRDAIDVQGAVIPIPRGWHAQDARSVDIDITRAYGFCVLRSGDDLSTRGCLDSGGILVRLARVESDTSAEPVQGSFQADCTETPTVPILQRSGSIGGLVATTITITCGDNKESSSTYWALADRTVTVQSPFDGQRSLLAASDIAQGIDLAHWGHVIPTAAPDQTTSAIR